MHPITAKPTRPAAVLEINNLTYRYATAASPSLEQVSLRVEPGQFLVLAGRSASGKSTLLRACCGLVPHFHGGELAGAISVAGHDALESGPSELASVVGYLAQEPESQTVSTTVAAEIAMPLEFRGETESVVARAVEEVALALAIPELLERTVDSLSGGELQRVALAAALVTRPKLVLLDEPTSQLDPVAGDELIWLLRRLNAEWGVTVILAEHRLERCLAAADRVVAMQDGRIGYDGDPVNFLAWASHAEPSLSTPSARMFAAVGLAPLPTGVRQARLAIQEAGLLATEAGRQWPSPEPQPGGDVARSNGSEPGSIFPRVTTGAALALGDLWVERGDDDELREVLRGLDLAIDPGECIALMGRNGAGKSTLLRTAAGLIKPVSGKVDVPGGMALLTQNPADYLVRERVGDELAGRQGAAALAQVGLTGIEDSDPRDLSGGQRQRLALAITVTGRFEPENRPGVIALDEPTRGLDRALKEELAGLARGLAASGTAVIIATHDVEFAAVFADRALLLGQGRLIADGPVTEILSGGWYFATEVARVLDLPGVITPEQGAAVLSEAGQ